MVLVVGVGAASPNPFLFSPFCIYCSAERVSRAAALPKAVRVLSERQSACMFLLVER